MPTKYDPETRAKAARLVLDHREDYDSELAAITAVSKRLGMTAETLRKWIRQHQVDDGQRTGVTSEAAAEIRALKLVGHGESGSSRRSVEGVGDSCAVGP